jgi:carboxyl-terminal processing protease
MIEPAARVLRVLLFALLLTSVSGVPAAFAAAEPAAAVSALAAEDAAQQVRVVGDAYSLLLDHFVRPLDTAALVQAGWAQLTQEAAAKAAPVGPPPAVTGDRAGDLEALRGALAAYLAEPNAAPESFVAAHAVIRGMVRFADEGHTYFLDPTQYRNYQSWARGDGAYVGIGISVSTRGAEPRIVEVYDDTPARQAGLQRNDVLLSIAGHPVAGMALDELVGYVRGAAGTSVEIVVRRGTDSTPLTFDVTRAQIRVQLVREQLVDDNIGYVSLRGFPEPSVAEAVERTIDGFQTAGVQGLILDLRGNMGGRIDVGSRLLSHFLPPDSSIYEEVTRDGTARPHLSRPNTRYDLPLVVLVDGGTASMGEIFAAAVQDHGAAVVLGTTTSGSVAAAQVYPLADGAGLQVTVFDVLSAEGKPLNKIGVVPDEMISVDPTSSQDSDAVVARAVEILRTTVRAGRAAAAGATS